MAQSRKYQVFVSSTFEDLKGERDQVVKAVLEMGHIPVGMEMFSAADEEQWNIIKRNIEASDYYVVIVAHRYGSMVDGVSYTEKEYDYALECKIPALGFILNDSAAWPEDRHDKGNGAEEQARKLKAFKEKVRRKPVAFWTTKDDLHAKVAIALMKTMTAQPRIGWIHASLAASAESASELARLSKENAELRAALDAAQKAKVDVERFEEIEKKLEEYPIFAKGNQDPLHGILPASTMLLDIFDVLGRSLASGDEEQHMAIVIATRLSASGDGQKNFRPILARLHDWLAEFIIQDIVAHEKVVHHGTKTRSVDTWALTETGRAFLRYRRGNVEESNAAELPAQNSQPVV